MNARVALEAKRGSEGAMVDVLSLLQIAVLDPQRVQKLMSTIVIIQQSTVLCFKSLPIWLHLYILSYKCID